MGIIVEARRIGKRILEEGFLERILRVVLRTEIPHAYVPDGRPVGVHGSFDVVTRQHRRGSRLAR